MLQILDSEEIELAGARHILERLQKRKLYKCVEQAEVSSKLLVFTSSVCKPVSCVTYAFCVRLSTMCISLNAEGFPRLHNNNGNWRMFVWFYAVLYYKENFTVTLVWPLIEKMSPLDFDTYVFQKGTEKPQKGWEISLLVNWEAQISLWVWLSDTLGRKMPTL